MSTTIERSKGTVRFAFKDSLKVLKNNRKKESLIYLFFTYGENRFKYSTGYKSCLDDWDVKKQRIKNKSAITNRDEINGHLLDLEKTIKNQYASLSLKFGAAVTSVMLKNSLDLFTKKVKIKTITPLTFFEIIDQLITQKENQISIITQRSYKQTKKRLEEYEHHYNEVLNFDDINMVFYNKFNAFMEGKDYALNTIGKHIKNFKTFLNYALIEGFTSNAKFKSNEFKAKKEITTEIYLTDDEIKKIHNKDLSKYPEIEHARDVFLIGCYTGQRISDYNKFSKEDIVLVDGVQYFKIKQHKNRRYGRTVMCPVTKEIKDIMNKRYDGFPPKPITESYLNEHIKTVGEMLKFNELVKCEITKGGKVLSEMIPKYQLIKSHTARRSFCTNKYKAGMSIFDIMLFSGHSTEKEFYKYIRIKDEERASHIVKSGFFNV